MDAESQARLLRATAEDFAKRIEAGDDVVVLFAAPGGAALVSWAHDPMDVTVLAANAFLAAAFEADAGVTRPDPPDTGRPEARG